ncbi:MAG: hypothetical protein ABSA52_16470 [Candidatus Binatia bacterium]|jgi:hypothetical protein
MSTIDVGKSANTQLKSGAAILAAAGTVDTRLIKDRLRTFQEAQQTYADAHAKVQHAEAVLAKAQAQFRTEQRAVVDTLARALVADGQQLRKPFAAFGTVTMGALIHMPAADAVKALPELVAAIRRSKTLGKVTLQAVPGAEKTTRGMEQALAHIEALGSTVYDARATRHAVAQAWEAALGALKRGARAAADDGAPALYATLFDRPARTKANNHKPAPAPTPSAPSAPEPVPAAS